MESGEVSEDPTHAMQRSRPELSVREGVLEHKPQETGAELGGKPAPGGPQKLRPELARLPWGERLRMNVACGEEDIEKKSEHGRK